MSKKHNSETAARSNPRERDPAPASRVRATRAAKKALGAEPRSVIARELALVGEIPCTDEESRCATEIVHALAHLLLARDGGDDGALRALGQLRTKAVEIMRERRDHVGATWDEQDGRWLRGPWGVVTGGPAFDAHTETAEVRGIQRSVRRALDSLSRRGWDRESTADHVAMTVIAFVIHNAPSLNERLPAERRSNLVRTSRDSAAKAILDSLERDVDGHSWGTEAAANTVTRAALRGLGMPRDALKAALDNPKRQGRGGRGGQKRKSASD